MRKIYILFCCLINLVVLPGCQPAKKDQQKIIIATAANMQFAMEALVDIYSEGYGTPCELIIGSSGKLTAQISQGAPYDLFIAANMKYPAEVERQGRAGSKPRAYARGTLVLWTADVNIQPSIPLLKSDSITHIAIANPRLAPYGEAAIGVLEHFGILDTVKQKLVYGESLAQVNQFVLSGAAEIGFTSLSVVLTPAMKGKGNWIELNRSLHSPIEQGVMLIAQEDGIKKEAREFYDFLFTEEAREVLKNFGYSVNE